MPGPSIDNLPAFREGDPLSAGEFQKLVNALKRQVLAPGQFQSGLFNVQRPIGGIGGTGAGVDIKIALVDADIPGIVEDKPTLNAPDATLTDDEEADGWATVFQDPLSDTLTANLVSKLPLWAYRRQKLTLKYYASQSPANAGTAEAGAATTITLDADATPSTLNDFYDGDLITLTGGTGSGQTKTITLYVGSTRVATVDSAWSTNPDATTTYEITSTRDLELATTVVDDTPHKKKVVRYATADFFWDDGKGFKVGKYDRSDFKDDPNYDPDGPFPPSSVVDPDTFLKRRWRFVFINGVFVERMCKVVPPPPLPEPA